MFLMHNLLKKNYLYSFFFFLFLKKKKKNAWGTRGKSLTLPLAQKRKKKKKIGTPFDIVVFPYNQRNSDINSPCLHITL